MSPDEFSYILQQIKPYTDYIYLHVLGEPLLHPELENILKIAGQKGFFVNITTNGSLLCEKKQIFNRQPVRQFNCSLHGAEENISKDKLESFFKNIFLFARANSDKSFFSFRLWNINVPQSYDFNYTCLTHINRFFGTPFTTASLSEKSLLLAPNIYLQNANRFSWPGQKKLALQHKKCYALKDHIAILVDGTVVPCCLDGEGKINLGNIFVEDLNKILSQEKACQMRKNLQNHFLSEPLCQDCGLFINERNITF
jgi:radical SAM protein with 4Fe4S-binding SPASM domain